LRDLPLGATRLWKTLWIEKLTFKKPGLKTERSVLVTTISSR
jgi:hypothetical protein